MYRKKNKYAGEWQHERAIEVADGGHTCLDGRNLVSCEGGERWAVVMGCSHLNIAWTNCHSPACLDGYQWHLGGDRWVDFQSLNFPYLHHPMSSMNGKDSQPSCSPHQPTSRSGWTPSPPKRIMPSNDPSNTYLGLPKLPDTSDAIRILGVCHMSLCHTHPNNHPWRSPWSSNSNMTSGVFQMSLQKDGRALSA
jgi:hypothetical protein